MTTEGRAANRLQALTQLIAEVRRTRESVHVRVCRGHGRGCMARDDQRSCVNCAEINVLGNEDPAALDASIASGIQ